jgi:CBS domain-containing protein
MLIQEIMTVHPIRIRLDSNMQRAAETISMAEVSDLMVVDDDDDNNFVGVLSEGDLVRAILPNFDEIIAVGGTLNDAFQYFIRKGKELTRYPIAPLVIRDAITLKPDEQAAYAATIMMQKQIRRLPVVENGKLVGTISRADICRAVIYLAR